MRPALLLLALVACYPPALRPDASPLTGACVTSCGMAVTWLQPGTPACAYASTAESNGLKAYAQKAHVPASCAQLSGWTVTTADEFSGTVDRQGGFTVQEPWGAQLVYGATYCDRHLLVVDGPSWRYGSFFHELGHALDCPRTNATHEGWETDGHKAAIDLAQSASP